MIEDLIRQAMDHQAVHLFLVADQPPIIELASGHAHLNSTPVSQQAITEIIYETASHQIEALQNGQVIQGEFSRPLLGTLPFQAYFQNQALTLRFQLSELVAQIQPVEGQVDQSQAISQQAHSSVSPSKAQIEEMHALEQSEFAVVLTNSKAIVGIMESFLAGFSYGCQHLESPADLVYLLERKTPKLIVIDDQMGFFSQTLEPLVNLQLDKRIETNITMISSQFPTGNSKAAYSMSADLVVNHQDVAQLPRLLERSLKEQKQKLSYFKGIRDRIKLGKDVEL